LFRRPARSSTLEEIEKGFTVVSGSVAPEVLDAAREDFRQWKHRNAPKFLPSFYKYDDRIDRIINLHAVLPSFRKLFAASRALAVQDYLFGNETVLYTSLFFETGTQQDIHRDIPFFWTSPAYLYFGTWTALESTDGDNGPLLVIPGSQRLPLMDRDAMARQVYDNLADIKDIDGALWDIYQARIRSLSAEAGLKAEEVHVRNGDTIIWHPMLAHGGAPIRDKRRTRLSFVVHTTPKDVPVFRSKVFFDVKRRVSSKPEWSYDRVEGRLLNASNTLSVGHSHDGYDFQQLV
jgi:ectoine hydroxylase-related dioxygenase (phytanoyl-CoA dioxygenase family)